MGERKSLSKVFMMNQWVTGDHHFGHANIIKYCNRPFSCSDEMDAFLVDSWNSVVGKNDTVLHLQDFTMGGLEQAVFMMSRLTGNIKILGIDWHHDYRWMRQLKKSNPYSYRLPSHVEIVDQIVVLTDVYKHAITLCHFPFEEWYGSHRGCLHFHAHSHGNLQKKPGRTDVGVDCNGFYPFSVEEAIERCINQ